MPVMGGIEASRKMRTFLTSRALEQPVIVGVTGHMQPEYIE